MDLREKFKQETGYDAYSYDANCNIIGFCDNYGQWLEEKFEENLLLSQSIHEERNRIWKDVCKNCEVDDLGELVEGDNIYFSIFKEKVPENRKNLINLSFEKAVEPAIRYLLKNHNPHTKIYVDYDRAELLLGNQCHNLSEEVPD